MSDTPYLDLAPLLATCTLGPPHPRVAELAPLRMLVVDDVPDAADALAGVLELHGCPVLACYDGPTALVTAATFRPQVCLLDLNMPEMDGLELAARLRDQAGGRPLVLVAVTSLDDIEALTWTALAGFHAHLLKTVDVSDLVATLARVGRVFARPAGPTPEVSSGSNGARETETNDLTSGPP